MAEVGLGGGGAGGMGRGMFALSVCVCVCVCVSGAWDGTTMRGKEVGPCRSSSHLSTKAVMRTIGRRHWGKTIGKGQAQIVVTRQVSDCGCASTTPRACFWKASCTVTADETRRDGLVDFPRMGGFLNSEDESGTLSSAEFCQFLPCYLRFSIGDMGEYDI
ncbi:hypothetical protein BGZ61DRAFT_23156 [Ilyonectria robusta]|uniref:uncharacterized protein n=1 Tax=Ilyonectria robusta TaxID=1079257 RepID=UPI001E8CE765|nr:uncharacterized protein BGZ61DRAFT_23156 [Ilyonectria robusta]KAH8737815.1 hypothetical protein BGZ61DRAFT_23156 [Ilyonectria robusta]